MVNTTTTNYGVPVSPSIERGIKSKYKTRFGLAYPLAKFKKVIPNTYLQQNNVTNVTYFGKAKGLALIKNNLKQLIRTQKGERVMLPDYGLSLEKYLFEPLDETTYELIKKDILDNIEKFFSIGRVLKLSIYSNETRIEKNQLVINLTLQLLDESLDILDIETRVG